MSTSKKKLSVKNAKPSSSSSHPPYFQMISEAITSLKDRTGSSQAAIAKVIEEQYASALQPNFRKMLSVQLKKLVKSEKLLKVKNSYKVSASVKVELVTKKKVVVKAAKVKRLSQVKTPEALKKKKTNAKTDQKQAVSGGKIKPASGGGKMKRLSEVKTPEAMRAKRKAGPTSRAAAKKAN